MHSVYHSLSPQLINSVTLPKSDSPINLSFSLSLSNQFILSISYSLTPSISHSTPYSTHSPTKHSLTHSSQQPLKHTHLHPGRIHILQVVATTHPKPIQLTCPSTRLPLRVILPGRFNSFLGLAGGWVEARGRLRDVMGMGCAGDREEAGLWEDAISSCVPYGKEILKGGKGWVRKQGCGFISVGICVMCWLVCLWCVMKALSSSGGNNIHQVGIRKKE